MNKRRQAADMTSPTPQSFSPPSQTNNQISPPPEPALNVRRSSSMPGPIGAGTPIPGTLPSLLPKLASVECKTPPQSDTITSAAVSSTQPQNLAPQQVVPPPVVESAPPGGRPEATGSKTGFMSKIFGKSKETQEDIQCELFLLIHKETAWERKVRVL